MVKVSHALNHSATEAVNIYYLYTTGVPDHWVAKKQANEGMKNVTDGVVKPTFERGHYAVDTLNVRGEYATCNGNGKAIRDHMHGAPIA